MDKTTRASKGTVSITADRGWLRLRWRHAGKRFSLYIGLPDTKANRKIAEAKATQIELDLKSGHFDPTLRAYKLYFQSYSQIEVVEVFNKFIQHKSKTVTSTTLDKYRALSACLRDYFKDQSASSIGVTEAEKFTDWYNSHNLSKEVIKERLSLLKACWQWAIEQDMMEFNPWADMPARIKVPPRQMPKPFTREEIEAIIQAFRTDPFYHHYTDFVEFRLGTGCRTGEVIGLRWKHVSDDCSKIWIGETLVKGKRQSTKTNKARFISLTSKLQAILQNRKRNGCDPEELVFKGPKGSPLDAHNFSQRAWKKILTRLNIEYRKPYITRHTLISHALDLGMNPVEVAQLTGHDVETLYKNYAGNVNSRPCLPEL